MFYLWKLASVGTLVAVVTAGCASGNSGTAARAAGSDAMMCPKCETVWVSRSLSRGSKIQQLTTERKMICPDCDAMARSALTGDGHVMLHNCPTCQVTPQRLTVQPAVPSHPKGTH